MLKKGHDPVSLLPVEVVFTYLFLPVTDAQFLREGERERENGRFMGCIKDVGGGRFVHGSCGKQETHNSTQKCN